MTNGVVSVMAAGKVAVKAVCGCDGYNAKRLADMCRRQRLTTARAVYDAAVDAGFGCNDCLVVQDADGTTVFAGGDDLPQLYAAKFADPRFNPRWNYGTAPHIEVVEL